LATAYFSFVLLEHEIRNPSYEGKHAISNFMVAVGSYDPYNVFNFPEVRLFREEEKEHWQTIFMHPLSYFLSVIISSECL